MAFGIYKPGQGYWVRVMTASMAGVLLLLAAVWVWNNLQLIPIPRTSWDMALTNVTGTIAPGQTVDLLGETDATSGQRPVLGTAVVQAAQPLSGGGARISVHKAAMNGALDPVDTKAISAAGGALTAKLSGSVQGQTAFPVIYIQAAGVGLLLVLGVLVTFWLVAVREGSSEFLIATDGEMKKVNWSSYRGVKDSTWVVILWSVLIAGGLFVVDAAFAHFFRLIGVLEQ